MLTAVNKIVESFLQPVVTPITRMPTYDTLVEQIYQISYNMVLIQTTLGGVKLGFLALAISPTVYATLSSTPFM